MIRSCVRACFHIDRGVTQLLHDVHVGFEGGKCALTDYVCKDLTTRAVRKKKGDPFDLLNNGVNNFMDLSLTLLIFIRPTTLTTLTRSTLVLRTKCWTSTFMKP